MPSSASDSPILAPMRSSEETSSQLVARLIAAASANDAASSASDTASPARLCDVRGNLGCDHVGSVP